jgi:hypothetical protein
MTISLNPYDIVKRLKGLGSRSSQSVPSSLSTNYKRSLVSLELFREIGQRVDEARQIQPEEGFHNVALRQDRGQFWR